MSPKESLPSRGARVEIVPPARRQRAERVAPLAGSAGRNRGYTRGVASGGGSLPSRGARVEIGGNGGSNGAGGSLPSRGARVEICSSGNWRWIRTSLPSRGARVEIPPHTQNKAAAHRSLPSRGARVEISRSHLCRPKCVVAPLAGSAGRNPFCVGTAPHKTVAPLAGSAGRNCTQFR